MCGIAGFVRMDGGPAELNTIQRMTDVIRHRGPNGEGHFIEGALALGHRRLSILDLSNDGAQPMHSPSGKLVLIFNGEIYNYIEIRQDLRASGYTFKTQTDTEVVLAAFDKWGEDCVSRFNGMWSFAIYNREQRRLFMSRDRFGVKPFYYRNDGNVFAFGSEIRQLLPFATRTVANMDAVRTYLITDASALDDTTFFEGIRQLPAGHSAIFDLAQNRLTIRRYYEITRRADIAALNVEDAIENFSTLFEDAIRLRLRSDVKVGTCLSGGMDSSSVAAIASALYRQSATEPFGAITAISEQNSNNEAPFAEIMAQSNGLDWFTVKPTYADFVETLPQIVRTQEEPFGSPSLTMQHFVMKTARDNGITVLLDGQGGDEILLGYGRYYASYIMSIFRKEGILAAINALQASARNNANMGPFNFAKHLASGLAAPLRVAFYNRRHRHFRRHPQLPHLSAFSRASFDSFALQKLEIESTNLPVLLRFEDKNSMAHSIETRLPFLDYRLLEFCLSLPAHYKIRDGWSKWILRGAMADRLPRAIVWRRNKLGFEAPEKLWLSQHFEQMKQTVLASPMLQQITATNSLGPAMDRLDNRSRWRLYSLALWEREFNVAA